ncbi:hypothetical protein CWI88_04440 [Enterobacter cancerogenus]|nr:hypothetical protein CWI88_04440 [Enterobacter cancerogenus]
MSPTSYQAAPPRVRLFASYFKPHLRWLFSFTSVTYWSKFLRIHCVAILLCFELLRKNFYCRRRYFIKF